MVKVDELIPGLDSERDDIKRAIQFFEFLASAKTGSEGITQWRRVCKLYKAGELDLDLHDKNMFSSAERKYPEMF